MPVVQLVRASDCGSECRRFESDRAPTEKKAETILFQWLPPLFCISQYGQTEVISATCTELMVLYTTYSDFRRGVDELLNRVMETVGIILNKCNYFTDFTLFFCIIR